MFKANKIRTNIFTTVKLILLCGLIYLIYYQLKSVDGEINELPSIHSYVLLILSILLVVPNIGLAYQMWKLILKRANIDNDVKTRRASFFAGIVTGMLTPNMVGNFIGRLYYFNKKHRGTITAMTLLSNYSQFLVSLLFGFISILVAGSVVEIFDAHVVLWGLLSSILVFALLYFYFERLIHVFYKKIESAQFKIILQEQPFFRVELIVLAAARFIVFSSQYIILLRAFGADVSWMVILGVWQVYLFTMIAPSLFLGKIGVKESISLFVLTAIGVNAYVVLLTSLIIWTVNSLSPAIVGLIICKDKESNANG